MVRSRRGKHPMTLLILNMIIMLLAAAGCLMMGGLVLNNPPLNEPPGFYTRLWTYLTTNVAETRRDHPFAELELRCYTLPPKLLFTRLQHALDDLGLGGAGGRPRKSLAARGH